MDDRILLSGMRFAGHHGVSAEERSEPQPIEVDLEVEADLRAAARSDEVRDTVDYGPLIELCREIVERNSFRLLEAIAATIAERTLETTAASAVTVRVRKLAVPADADLDYAQVQLRRTREARG